MEPNYFNEDPIGYQPVKATGWLIATYIFVLTGGWLAIVFGFTVFFSKVNVDGYKEPNYIQSHRTLGLIGGILGIISVIVWRIAMS